MPLAKQGNFKKYRNEFKKIMSEYQNLIDNYDGLYGDYPDNNKDIDDIFGFISDAYIAYHDERRFSERLSDLLEDTEIKTDYVKNDFKGMVRDLQNAANDLVEKANNMITWLGDDLSDLEKNTLDEYRFW